MCKADLSDLRPRPLDASDHDLIALGTSGCESLLLSRLSVQLSLASYALLHSPYAATRPRPPSCPGPAADALSLLTASAKTKMATSSERQVQELISEQFAFSPAAFTRRAEDVANAVIYNVMEAVEKDMFARLGDSDAIKKLLVSLETLLENGVDKQFDKFEAFCFRNVFTLKEELLPYIRLEHHPLDGFDEALRGRDTELLSEWVRERDAADEAMVKAASARVAAARVDRRWAALQQLKSELDALTQGQDAGALPSSLGSALN